MTWRGFRLGGRLVEPECALAEALEPSRGHPYTYAMLARMVPRYQRERISATLLSTCLRRLRLMRDHDYYLDPDDAWSMVRGTFFHAGAAEDPPPGVEVERAYARPLRVGDRVVLVEGVIDYWDPGRAYLLDYKTTSRLPSAPYESHLAQVNVYNWLVEMRARRADLVYLDLTRVVRFPVDLWPQERVERYLADQIQQYLTAMASPHLPPLLPEAQARYQCPRCPVRDICEDLYIDAALERG